MCTSLVPSYVNTDSRLLACRITGYSRVIPLAPRTVRHCRAMSIASRTLLVDVITGLHAGLGILAALRHRERTGKGQRVEVSLLTSLLSALTNQASAYVGAGVVPKAMGNRHPSIAPYEVFQAKDRPLVLAVGDDRQFRMLCDRLGRAELCDDPRFTTNTARVAHRDELLDELAGPLARRTADDWFGELTAAGVPCGPINDLAAAFDLAERLGLGAQVRVDDPRRDAPVDQVANPISLGATPPSYRTAPPLLGEDTTALLAELGRCTEAAGEAGATGEAT